jgi:hypothetical protein
MMPWATTVTPNGLTQVIGTQGYGKITAAIGVILIMIAILTDGRPGKIYNWMVPILSAGAAIFLLIIWRNLNRDLAGLGTGPFIASIGIGMHLGLMGAVLTFLGGWVKVPKSS